MGFKKVDLNEIAEITTGFAFKSKEFNTEGKGVRLIRGKNVSTDFVRWGDDTRYWSGDTSNLEDLFLQVDDIVIGMDGSKIGHNYARIKQTDLPALLVQRVARLRSNGKINQKLLYYYINNNDFTRYIMNVKTGTSIPHISAKQILNYEINLPTIRVQENIVSLIEPLVEKIEINKKMINNLDQLSQTLFKQWFIDFEFPNEEGKPYKSSGGEMVESELGEIPKGWKVFPLYDLAEYINGTSFKKHELQNEKNDLPIIKIAELKSGFSGNTKYFIGEKDKKYYLKNGDILFSWSGNPETSIDTFFWTRGKGILNQHIFKVVSTKYPQQLIYILLKYFKPTFSRIASNKQTTGLGHVTVKDLKRLKVVLPLDSSPYVQLNHLGDLILNLNLENIKLQELRDTLLPKLLSGEIEIPDDLEV